MPMRWPIALPSTAVATECSQKLIRSKPLLSTGLNILTIEIDSESCLTALKPRITTARVIEETRLGKL